ncbi:predicted protein [Lichtheimia corymbifera JMRC:FSU:9682]|uniref:Uncharacterized protein n=1 Tax=Lichtheimia corymbifera JMRC:FSU:9682 TaxID=1263082 RepID=A0A068RZN8_9FUNG|nr:predicted protein [Lichtheimia corymbifera JMRC:FSU:9682]
MAAFYYIYRIKAAALMNVRYKRTNQHCFRWCGELAQHTIWRSFCFESTILGTNRMSGPISITLLWDVIERRARKLRLDTN